MADDDSGRVGKLSRTSARLHPAIGSNLSVRGCGAGCRIFVKFVDGLMFVAGALFVGASVVNSVSLIVDSLRRRIRPLS